ncbi:uncharacterized protein LOC125834820 [Solanum verrucosum]|uniref:uncharacterized protein LOC125834820 n=1 Tax=Solanum verrucosum TaxID=315347 RepID=UPI0020D0C034|nr:uncharacterized protein LOC125834820 [Solanum verrucosum]
MYEDQDLDIDEEDNYSGNQGGFQKYNSGNQGYNSGNAGRSYARDGQYERPTNRDQRNWQNREGYRNDRSGVYVLPGNRDRVSGSSNGSKLEDMMAKVLQKVESTDAGVKEMRGDFPSMSQLVDSHTTSIKQIEQQLGQLSASMNQRKNGSLPTDTIQNPKKKGHCIAIATRSGKVLSDPSSAGTKYEQVLEQASREEDENIPVDDQGEAQQSQPKQIPRPPHPFPQRLKKKAEDGKFTKFFTMLKQLSVNIRLVESLEQMPGYAKFMKDLVTKKRTVSHDFSNDVHHCSAITTRSLVQKKEDPGVFTIPCTIGSIKFAKALCDLGASINLMPLAIYKKLGLGVLKYTSMRLMVVDRSVKRPLGIICDVLVKVDTFIFPADFVILDCEVNFEVPIILGRPFLATGRALVDVERGELKFRLNTDKVRFNICRDREFIAGYGNTFVCAKQIGLGLEKHAKPPAKPSIEEPPVLELKQLPNHLRYVFLGTNNTLHVILAADLNEEQVFARIKFSLRKTAARVLNTNGG